MSNLTRTIALVLSIVWLALLSATFARQLSESHRPELPVAAQIEDCLDCEDLDAVAAGRHLLASAECKRTKPVWLGPLQGAGSIIRFGVLSAITGFDPLLSGCFNSLFEALKIAAIVIDIVQTSYWLDILLGNNALLQGIELVLAFHILSKYYESEELGSTARGFLVRVVQFVYLLRGAFLLGATVVAAVGVLGYGWMIPALGVVFGTALYGWRKMGEKWGTEGGTIETFLRNIKAKTNASAVAAFLLVLLIICLQFTEWFGIGGWNLLIGHPRGLPYMEYVPFTNKCTGLYDWLRDDLDYLVMIFSVV